jgi:hypothetical protein
MITFPLILSAIIGFTVAELISGQYEGHHRFWKSIQIKVKDYTFHVHHWLYASAALIALPSSTEHKTIIEAFLIGVIVQGLTYKDFYKVVRKESGVMGE